MKRFGLGLFLVYIVLLITPKLWADRNGHENDGTNINAVEMGAIGLIAASVTGAAVYLVRRRRGGSGK